MHLVSNIIEHNRKSCIDIERRTPQLQEEHEELQAQLQEAHPHPQPPMFPQMLFRKESGPLSVLVRDITAGRNSPSPTVRTSAKHHLPPLTALFSNFPPYWPEIEWLPVSAYIGNNENKQTADPRDGSNYATSSNAIISPLSRSTVSLQGPEMTTPPVIDKELAIQGFKRQRQVWEVLVDLGIADPVEAFP
jgi:choline dehydrogenase